MSREKLSGWLAETQTDNFVTSGKRHAITIIADTETLRIVSLSRKLGKIIFKQENIAPLIKERRNS
jgi:hypothetical protein